LRPSIAAWAGAHSVSQPPTPRFIDLFSAGDALIILLLSGWS